MTLRSMSLKEFMHLEQKVQTEDPLAASYATDMTEIVDAQSSDAFRRESASRAAFDHTPSKNNFMSSEQTLADIHVDIANQSVKQPGRKEDFLFDMELKAEINSVKRKQKTKEKLVQEERLKMQQEVLLNFLKKPAVNVDDSLAPVPEVMGDSIGVVAAAEASLNDRGSAMTPLESSLNGRTDLSSLNARAEVTDMDSSLNDRTARQLDQFTPPRPISEATFSSRSIDPLDGISESGALDRDTRDDIHQEIIDMRLTIHQQDLSASMAQAKERAASQMENELLESGLTSLIGEDLELSYSMSKVSHLQSLKPASLPDEKRTQSAQQRQFYYDVAGVDLAVQSEDFDEQYAEAGQSQLLASLEVSSKTVQPSRIEESLPVSEHELVGQSDNSLVNFAVTVDHFQRQAKEKQPALD